MKKDKSIASKTTLNLAMRDKKGTNPALAILALVLVGVVALAVAWATASELSQVGAARREVRKLEEQLAATRSAYADYDEVEAEYNRYTYKDFDRTIADRLDVMDILERDVFPVCQVQDFSVFDHRMSLVLEGLTMESTSALITRLNAEALVETVNVSTYDATTDSGRVYPVTHMDIVLADATQTGEVD